MDITRIPPPVLIHKGIVMFKPHHQLPIENIRNQNPQPLLVFAAGLIQTAVAGIDCYSICAACWKIGSTTGEDTKISCDLFGGCPDVCPTGYDRMHCAKQSRCECAEPDCDDFGPCACGVVTSSGKDGNWKKCKPSDGSGAC